MAPARQTIRARRSTVQRRTAVALGVLFAAVTVIVAVWTAVPARSKSAAAPSASARKPPAPVTSAARASDLLDTPSSDLETAAKGSGQFDRLPNGAPVPELPATAPKSVAFGVILVTYRGAQLAPESSPDKAAALEKAKGLIGPAQKDFADTVKKGDRGSQTDAGRIPRGILEPAVEYVLFSMPKGAVHPEPVDTPRGFWIVKRND
jgi:hypothetical protein